jgi:hypothetical protein
MMVAAELQMTTMVVISTEQAARELGKTDPADPAGLMKPLPPSVESAGQSEHYSAQSSRRLKCPPWRTPNPKPAQLSKARPAADQQGDGPSHFTEVATIVDTESKAREPARAAPVAKCHQLVTDEATARVLANGFSS